MLGFGAPYVDRRGSVQFPGKGWFLLVLTVLILGFIKAVEIVSAVSGITV